MLSDQLVPDRDRDRMRTVRGTEPVGRVPNVGAHGLGPDPEPLPDLLELEPLGEQRQHLSFTVRQVEPVHLGLRHGRESSVSVRMLI